MIGSLHIKGIGRNIATAVVHICDEKDRYGLWNNRTEETLKMLRRAPIPAPTPGETYSRINLELNQLKKELGTNLMILDCLMWYIRERVKIIGN